MRKALPALLGILSFVSAYLILSFCIPAFQIKLEAEPGLVFWETLKVMAPFKGLVSLAVGAAFGALTFLFCKKKP